MSSPRFKTTANARRTRVDQTSARQPAEQEQILERQLVRDICGFLCACVYPCLQLKYVKLFFNLDQAPSVFIEEGHNLETSRGLDSMRGVWPKEKDLTVNHFVACVPYNAFLFYLQTPTYLRSLPR